jgi:hypothetical protein
VLGGDRVGRGRLAVRSEKQHVLRRRRRRRTQSVDGEQGIGCDGTKRWSLAFHTQSGGARVAEAPPLFAVDGWRRGRGGWCGFSEEVAKERAEAWRRSERRRSMRRRRSGAHERGEESALGSG